MIARLVESQGSFLCYRCLLCSIFFPKCLFFPVKDTELEEENNKSSNFVINRVRQHGLKRIFSQMTFSVQFPSRLYESREKETLGKEKEEKAGKPEKGPENQRESQRRPAAFPVEDRCRQDRSETIPKSSTYFF